MAAPQTKLVNPGIVPPSQLWEKVRERVVITTTGRQKISDLFPVGTLNYFNLVRLAAERDSLYQLLADSTVEPERRYENFANELQRLLSLDTPPMLAKIKDASAIVEAIKIGVAEFKAQAGRFLVPGSFVLRDQKGIPIKMGDHLTRLIHAPGTSLLDVRHHGLYMGTSEELLEFNKKWPGILVLEIVTTVRTVSLERWVVHFYPGRTEKGMVMLTTLTTFLEGDVQTVQKVIYQQEEPLQNVFRRAMQRFGDRNYNLGFNNCEHFATYAKTGKLESAQIKKIFDPLHLGYVAEEFSEVAV